MGQIVMEWRSASGEDCCALSRQADGSPWSVRGAGHSLEVVLFLMGIMSLMLYISSHYYHIGLEDIGPSRGESHSINQLSQHNKVWKLIVICARLVLFTKIVAQPKGQK